MSVLELEGTPFEIGLQHGKKLKCEINEFLSHSITGFKKSFNELSNNQINFLLSCYKIIQEQIPHVADEIKGLAIGSNISLIEALSLQYKRELEYPNLDKLSECTVFWTKKNSNGTILAQNIDLAIHMEKIGHVFNIVTRNNSLPNYIMYSFSGMLGYTGINSKGVAIAINFLLSPGWKIGISPYLVIRHLLSCNNLNECLESLKKLTISSSRCITISHNSKVASIEITPEEIRILSPSDEGVHTNHYIHKDLKVLDYLQLFTKNASKQRYNDCLKQLNLVKNIDDNFSEVFEILSSHNLHPIGLCAHASKGSDKTVATIAMQSNTKKIIYRKGNPCTSKSYELFVTS